MHNYITNVQTRRNLERRAQRRAYCVGGHSSGWDRDKVQVVTTPCQIVSHRKVDELEDCVIYNYK